MEEWEEKQAPTNQSKQPTWDRAAISDLIYILIHD